MVKVDYNPFPHMNLTYTTFTNLYDGVRIYFYNNITGNNTTRIIVHFSGNDRFIPTNDIPTTFKEFVLDKHHYSSIFGEWKTDHIEFYEMRN